MQLDPIAKNQIDVLGSGSAFKIIQPRFRIVIFISLLIFFFLGLRFPFSIGLIIVIIAFINYMLLLSFRLSNIEKLPKSLIFSRDTIHDLPTVSVLMPLKNEGHVIEDTIQHIIRQDYPVDKMELIIIVEITDEHTQSALEEINLPTYCKIILIPSLNPFTKGRALLHGLKQANHQIITVMDAESHPEPDQFAKAARLIASSTELLCLQSKVRISNKNQNWITRNFATEYFEWFDHFLQQLSNQQFHFGLGGNSFYIDRKALVASGAWDPFNVTEDAELSVRLIQSGFSFKLLDSYTDEICPDSISNWIYQRVRWNKGLLITQFSHLISSLNKKGFDFSHWIHFWLRMTAGSMLPVFNLFVFIYFLLTWISPRKAMYADLAMWTLMVVSLVFMILVNWISFKRLKINKNLLTLIPGAVGYILLHILAGFWAYYEFLIQPLKWNNTKHE